MTSQTPQTPQTSYLTTDTLGSPRVITDNAGNVTSRRDFMPFGEEIASLGNRTAANGYQTDATRQKFTGYERDSESGLDFAQTRMYSNKLGRFNSPDPIKMSSERLFSPQEINLYAYASNNPLSAIDPSGMEIIRLGRSEAEINADISSAETALKGDITDNQRKQLQTNLANYRTELTANKVIGAWLAAANSVGELKGVKLSNLYIATNIKEDYVAIDMEYVKKNFPQATKSRIEKLKADSQTRANEGAAKIADGVGPRARTLNGKIYIFTENALFQDSIGERQNFKGWGIIPQGDFNILGAGILGHERWHQRYGDRSLEPPAYREELRILRKFTPEAIGNKAFIEAERKEKADLGGVKYP